MKLSNATMKKELKYSQIIDNWYVVMNKMHNILQVYIRIILLFFSHNFTFFNKDNNYEELTKNNVVAIQPQQNTIFSNIDFTDIVSSTNPADIIILNLNLNHMIDHTLPKIDRCCKLITI